MTRILIAGAGGQVGNELQRALAPLGSVLTPGRAEMDLRDTASIRRTIRGANPEIIVNAAAYTMVDQAESEPEAALQVNGIAPGIMAEEARRIGALLVHYSTDYVFDGESGRPYSEEEAPRPVNAYGRSKLEGERAIAAIGGAHFILRTSWVYSGRRANFVLAILRLAREKPELAVVADQTGSPTWARALAASTAELLRLGHAARDRAGLYHLCAAGRASRYELAQAIIEAAREASGIDSGWARVKPVTSREYPLPARRPHHTVMDSARIRRVFGIEMTDWREQLRSCVLELAARDAAGPHSGLAHTRSG